MCSPFGSFRSMLREVVPCSTLLHQPKHTVLKCSQPHVMQIHTVKENTWQKIKKIKILGMEHGGLFRTSSRYHEETKMKSEEEAEICTCRKYVTWPLRNTSNKYKRLSFLYLPQSQVFEWQERKWRSKDHLFLPVCKWKPWDLGLCWSPGHIAKRLCSPATKCYCFLQRGTSELITEML